MQCNSFGPSSFYTDSKVFKDTSETNCVMSCCLSCSFCRYKRATTKERYKPRSYEERNKACQRCILSRSLSFCPQCSKCPQCCKQSHSGRSLTEVLASLGKLGFKSQGNLDFERGLHASLQNEPPSHKVTSGSEWLCKPGQEPVSKRPLIQKLVVEKVVVCSSLAFYNRLFLIPKPNQKWRPILDLSQLNLYLCPETFKMETPETIRLSLQQGEWVTFWTSAMPTSISPFNKGRESI